MKDQVGVMFEVGDVMDELPKGAPRGAPSKIKALMDAHPGKWVMVTHNVSASAGIKKSKWWTNEYELASRTIDGNKYLFGRLNKGKG